MLDILRIIAGDAPLLLMIVLGLIILFLMHRLSQSPTEEAPICVERVKRIVKHEPEQLPTAAKLRFSGWVMVPPPENLSEFDAFEKQLIVAIGNGQQAKSSTQQDV